MSLIILIGDTNDLNLFTDFVDRLLLNIKNWSLLRIICIILLKSPNVLKLKHYLKVWFFGYIL